MQACVWRVRTLKPGVVPLRCSFCSSHFWSGRCSRCSTCYGKGASDGRLLEELCTLDRSGVGRCTKAHPWTFQGAACPGRLSLTNQRKHSLLGAVHCMYGKFSQSLCGALLLCRPLLELDKARSCSGPCPTALALWSTCAPASALFLALGDAAGGVEVLELRRPALPPGQHAGAPRAALHADAGNRHM